MFLLRLLSISICAAAACAAQCTVTFQQSSLNAPGTGKAGSLGYTVSSDACYGQAVTSNVSWIVFAQEGTGLAQTTTLNSSGVLRYYVLPNSTSFNRLSSFFSGSAVVTMAQAPGTPADPAVIGISAPQYAVAGKTVEAIAVMGNLGTMASANPEIRFFWSADATITNTDVNTGQACTPTLGSYSEFRCVAQVTPPAAGTWYLGALITDPTDTNQSNNTAVTLPAVTVTTACATVDQVTLGFGPDGGTGVVNVTAPPDCNWSAFSSLPAGVQQMISAFPQTGAGNGQVRYTIYPNFRNAARVGTLNIGGNAITVTQAADANAPIDRYIRLLYFSFLGRLPSVDEIAFQRQANQTPTQRAAFAKSLLSAQEFNLGGRFAAGLYVGLLNRDAEFSGWVFQRNAFITGQVTQQQMVSNFLNSPEYALKFGSPDNPTYVRLLYRYILLREPSQPEVDFQAGALNTGTSRVQLAVNFLNSQEFQIGTAPRLMSFLISAGLYARDPQAAERVRLQDQIAAGFNLQDLTSVIMATPEFTSQVE